MKTHVQKTNRPTEKLSTLATRKNAAPYAASAFAQETEALDETSARHDSPRGHDLSQIDLSSRKVLSDFRRSSWLIRREMSTSKRPIEWPVGASCECRNRWAVTSLFSTYPKKDFVSEQIGRGDSAADCEYGIAFLLWSAIGTHSLRASFVGIALWV